MSFTKNPSSEILVPAAHNWRTTDVDEINKRRLRARQESFSIANIDSRHPIFSNFQVKSMSGLTYSVEIRGLDGRQCACDCVDFRINGLGTCKHIEAVLLQLQRRFRGSWDRLRRQGSMRLDVLPDSERDSLRLVSHGGIPSRLREWFDADGQLCGGSPEEALAALEALRQDALPLLRVSQEVAPWLESRRRTAEGRQLRHEYTLKVQSGEWPAHETTVPLFPYQREGMLHLAFVERALLADEMGLGKTIQAVAACGLLHRLGKATRVLVVTPASLKTEWEEQIRNFTVLPYQLVFGGHLQRLRAYANPPFFTIVNYEQMVADALDVNERLRPDVVVLDEAQRIKNWNTKTAQAIKRLRSRYAFVLTGTPIENRIDELHSLMDFLNPAVLGPLFRFNRDFYELDHRGRPIGYRNLDQLHVRIRPFMLRRRKAEVETELPERTDRNHFVIMSDLQKKTYAAHEQQVMKLINVSQRRLLTPMEQEKLQRELAMMRMICDTNYILDADDRTCPKLAELEGILQDCRENDTKVIVFSEWERMLELVRDLCDRRHLGYAWHTGSVPQKRRRAEINAFKSDPNCRIFLSTDSGATGLNLQNASAVINCDLPWNPAKLEQRIARAWRKNQTRPVTVINLVSENSIEHRMLDTLARKQTVADSVLDGAGAIKEVKLRAGRSAFVERLQQLVTRPAAPSSPEVDSKAHGRDVPSALPADPSIAFAQLARERLAGNFVRCEERYPDSGPQAVLLVVVERDAASLRGVLGSIHRELFRNEASESMAPSQLEVIDRETNEALERLIATGLITPRVRASRALFPGSEAEAAPPLSPEELARAKNQREVAARKIKMARLLHGGGLREEAQVAASDAILLLSRALAIEYRMPEPNSVQDAVVPPLCHAWKSHASTLRGFTADPAAALVSVLEVLEKL